MTARDYPEILVHWSEDHRAYLFEWPGPRAMPAWLSPLWQKVEPADLPWPVKVLEEPAAVGMPFLLLRTDHAAWWLTELRYRLWRVARMLNFRLLMTAMIWRYGLPLRRVLGRRPEWRDLWTKEN